MKRLLFSLLVLFCLRAHAQDYLLRKDHTGINVRITGISDQQVSYRLYSDTAGPAYSVAKNELLLILREDGGMEPVSDSPLRSREIDADSMMRQNMIAAKREAFEKYARYRNIFFANLLEPVNSCIGLSYSRELGRWPIILHVPVSFSYGKPALSDRFNGATQLHYPGLSGLTITQKPIDIGLGIYYNAGEYERVSYFIGPLFRYAQYSGSYTAYADGVAGQELRFSLAQTTVLINNGVLFRLTPRFNIMAYGAAGTSVSDKFITNDPTKATTIRSSDSGLAKAAFQFGLSIGLRL